ncbi:hypothetical protein PVAG01_10819 [Phlyctema vagabunda]|uniref:Uncharacterized protein n=1 Tax=Phlyctema vagabunda TaxID=108571 RepID=A0ABR4P3C1_9HELO
MATPQEELAALFSRNLSLQNNPYAAPQEVVQEKTPEPEPYTYSITQHYHHSNHVVPQQPSRPASEPPQTDQLTTDIILSRHGVDSANLSPSQLELFRSAEAGQQMRLIELWRICPPSYGDLSQEVVWQSTSFHQEEAMAKLRYERQMLEERMSRTQDQQMESAEDAMSDDSITVPLTPIQGGDGRWSGLTGSAEPYMSSGYEMLAAREYEQSKPEVKDVYSHFGTAVGGPKYNQATDPVYNSGRDWHEQQQQQAMENQYGAFQQTNNTWGGANSGVYHGEDEEML